MSSFTKLKLAFQIFEDCGLGNEYPSAEHDEIYGPDDDARIPEESKKLLEGLGWFIDKNGYWKTFV